MRRSVESAPTRSQSATASAFWATRHPISAARTCPVSRVGSAARFGSRSISTCPAVASLHTASVRTGRPMCDRYSRRTCAISAMLGTSTTPRSPGFDNSDMIRIDTRVLPVPHGSTSVARAGSRGIQSIGFRPSQRSRCSGNPARSACTHAATASCCMAVRGSGWAAAYSRSRALSRASASAASKSTNVTAATAAAILRRRTPAGFRHHPALREHRRRRSAGELLHLRRRHRPRRRSAPCIGSPHGSRHA